MKKAGWSRNNLIWSWVPAGVVVLGVCVVVWKLWLASPRQVTDTTLPFVLATAKLHDVAMTVGSILAAFTMIVAYMSKDVAPDRPGATLFFRMIAFSAMAFVCAVCASALAVFVSKAYVSLRPPVDHLQVFWNLTWLSGAAGFLGVLSFLTAFGLQGRLAGAPNGVFTVALAVAALAFMALAVCQVTTFAMPYWSPPV